VSAAGVCPSQRGDDVLRAKAVRKEANIAIQHWWGVCPTTVRKWRRALDIPATTEGTSQLRSEHFAEPWGEEARRKAWSKARDPERRKKIAASRNGKPRYTIGAALPRLPFLRPIGHEMRPSLVPVIVTSPWTSQNTVAPTQ